MAINTADKKICMCRYSYIDLDIGMIYIVICNYMENTKKIKMGTEMKSPAVVGIVNFK